MNKSDIKDLARQLSEQYDLSKEDAEKFVELMFAVLNDGIHYDKQVKIKGLGTFKVMSVAPRKSVNVQTGEPIMIEGRDKISFIPDAAMRDAVNRPFAQFETVVLNEGVDFTPIDKKYAAGLPEEDIAPEETTLPEASEPQSVVEQTTETSATPAAEPDTSAIAEPVDGMPPHAELETQEAQEAVGESTAEPQPHAESLTQDAEDAVEAPVEKESADDEPPAIAPSASEPAAEEHAQIVEESKPQEPAAISPEEKPADDNRITNPAADRQAAVEESAANISAKELRAEIHHNKRLIHLMGVAVVVLLVAFTCITCYFFRELTLRENRIQHLETSAAIMNSHKLPVQASVDSSALAKSKADSARIAQPAKTVQAMEAEQEKKEQQSAATPEPATSASTKSMAVQTPKAQPAAAKAVTTPAGSQEDKTAAAYDKDPRVRTGAYRITGIDHTVTVKAGQTLADISLRALGPGMECYVEAVNGGRTEFKEGEKVKIPALKHKKAK